MSFLAQAAPESPQFLSFLDQHSFFASAWGSLVKVAVATLVALLVLWFLRRVLKGVIDQRLATAPDDPGHLHRVRRARTLFNSFQAVMRLTILTLLLLFALGQFRIDYSPLLVAAGGLSLAVGFGAQTLVRDFLSGFFIVLENQFSVGDIVEIQGKEGAVETINLRTTVLRAFDGNVLVFPNSLVDRVTNKTKGWSRAIVDIVVAYEEDLDHVMGVLAAVAAAMREGPEWSKKILDFNILGVEATTDVAATLRVAFKTIPGEQWACARAYRKRVKKAFEEVEIEMPAQRLSAVPTPRANTGKAVAKKETRKHRKTGAVEIAAGKHETEGSSFEARDKEAAILRAEDDARASEEAASAKATHVITPQTTGSPATPSGPAAAVKPEAGTPPSNQPPTMPAPK
ncbi:MAG: mechanosensitive ion channel [Planctomycetes bacterium]|nr:mechanosensitive ion channel [Planctomycetota bacterium]